MIIKLKKVKNGDCFDCDVRVLSRIVNIILSNKLNNLCMKQECAKHRFIYKQVK